MRQRAGTLNRIWLAVLGLLALACGTGLLLQAAGALQGLLGTAPAGEKVLTGDLHSFAAQSWAPILLLIVGVVIGVLGFLWAIAQIPRKNPAEPYRLHADAAQGRTLCDPSVLAAAVEDQVNTLPGVLTSSALLRGSADQPDLTLKLTVTGRADIRDLLGRLEATALPDLATALEAPLRRCRLQIEVTARPQSTGTVVHSTGTVLH
jgi:hypothetical protein